jgi:HK97 family phage prohead protease
MILSKDQKLSMSYAVKSDSVNRFKEVDTSARTVELIANTYNYMDADLDILLPGCCAKSIQERGPKSDLPGKIKHLSNHNIDIAIARVDSISEEKYNGMDVLRGKSYMSETTAGEETLIKYKEGIIDQHSIGFRYTQIEYVEQDTVGWDEMMKSLINTDEAEKHGYGWLVKEIMLYEYSSLDGFGANRLTPFLGVKTDNKTIQYNNLIEKLNAVHTAMKSGSYDKDNMKLKEAQIKQMIYELFFPEPSIKDTYVKPSGGDTKDIDIRSLIPNKILN